MKTTFIYCLRDPRTGQVRYVGKANDLKVAFRRHLRYAKIGKEFHCSRWIREMLSQKIKPLIEIIDEVPFEYWPQWEVAYIALHKEEGCPLTNMTPGGDSGPVMPGNKHPMFGKKHKAASVLNMRAAKAGELHPMQGKKHSPQAIIKMSISHVGKTQPDEARKKIQAGLFGIKKKSNTSGFCGVSKLGKKWRAYFKVAGKQIHIGVFNTKEDAARALVEIYGA